MCSTSRARGARSVLINCREGERPHALYLKLGFTDVVHRQWRFELT